MPFNSETASAAGKRGGGGRSRWKDKDPDTVRNKQLKVSLAPDEFQTIEDKAARLGLSKPDLIIKAVRAYRGK